jgi:hypothetical protein
MATTTTAPAATTPPPTTRTSGRWLYWLGIAAVVLGVAAYFVQFMALKILTVPWYAPILATVGVIFLVVSFLRRHSLIRLITLVLLLFVAGAEWAFVGWMSRVPAYEGPAIGQPLPDFAISTADGTALTNRDLVGQPTVLVFYRGHL